MIGYLGVPGALVELRYRGGLSVDSGRPVSFQRTLGGKRKALLGPQSRREWSVSFDLIGSRMAGGLLAAAQSEGPLMWYPADAAAGNLLSPQGSGFESRSSTATDVGLVQLPDGSVARAVAPTGTVNVTSPQGDWEMVPVRPGRVTVGGWGFNGIRFTGAWRDAEGVTVGTFAPSSSGHSGWQWVERTITAPADAAFLSLSLSNGARYARPSVAWGTAGRDRPGRGCPKAVAHGLSEGLTVISGDDAYGSVSATITEVG